MANYTFTDISDKVFLVPLLTLADIASHRYG
jgi:hypothetical protein